MNMKTTLLILTIWVASIISTHAQNLIGYTKQDAKDVMKSLHQDEWTFKTERVLDSGVETVQYKKTDNPVMMVAYYFFDGICSHYVHLLPRELLTTTIESLNKYYYREGDNVWVSKDMKLKMTLEVESELYIAIVTNKI
jgi:hypothetical protein